MVDGVEKDGGTSVAEVIEEADFSFPSDMTVEIGMVDDGAQERLIEFMAQKPTQEDIELEKIDIAERDRALEEYRLHNPTPRNQIKSDDIGKGRGR